MAADDDRIPDEAARAIWRRAAHLQAEAERRQEERARQVAAQPSDRATGDGLRADEIRIAAEEAGIAPEFIQIALAEAAALPVRTTPEGRWDRLGAKLFLGATGDSIEVSATVEGDLDTVSAATLQVFCGHPCLLQTGEVVEIPSTAGRVIVFNVPPYDWSVTANPPFVEKAAAIGLEQLHVAIRPLPEDGSRCEVVVAGDLRTGARKRWRWSAAVAVGAGAGGAAAGVGIAGAAMAGAILALPALAGAAALGASAAALWGVTHRYYCEEAEASLKQSLRLLPATIRVTGGHGKRELPRGEGGGGGAGPL